MSKDSNDNFFKKYTNLLLLLISFAYFSLSPTEQPRVSIITSVYDGDEFIEAFLYDIVRQTIFKDCELILINANSPGHEETTIKRFMQHYPNIVYINLGHDPGLYAVWNLAIKQAKAPLITNANLDDRRNPECVAIQAKALEDHPDIDLVYANYRVSYTPNELFEQSNSLYPLVTPPEFSLKVSYLCLAGPQPMWRKALHDKYGYFNESFLYSGDMEMWSRAISKGSQFKKIPIVSGLYYLNPKGLSTDPDTVKVQRRYQENKKICDMYSYLWS